MDICNRAPFAYLSTGLSGMLTLVGSILPHTWQDASYATAVLAGILGGTLSIQQMYFNYKRNKRRRR